MKFYTLVLFDENFSSDSCIEKFVQNQMQPFKLIEDDDRPFNHDWKWDYYCLYDKEEMIDFGFKEPEYKFALNSLSYVICSTDKLSHKQMPFAVLTPDGNWINGSYPRDEHDPNWPEKALAEIVGCKAKYGVYVYCHS